MKTVIRLNSAFLNPFLPERPAIKKYNVAIVPKIITIALITKITIFDIFIIPWHYSSFWPAITAVQVTFWFDLLTLTITVPPAEHLFTTIAMLSDVMSSTTPPAG
ncbi:hypothetical protein [Arcticibacter tournemirensis]|uniref:Uncharacterized protein n=1 Tax=Arcticibacter tournemirensis TaxID=699437 RepID=A0A4Q0M4V0_9SPHI|nr:hypothetical protein [Arcticibacter tournemirensis]RXF67749.1 hypothetical protein EKH83_18155 [Arcticibacter tournemirensis]